jgi:hypothetical protein
VLELLDQPPRPASGADGTIYPVTLEPAWNGRTRLPLGERDVVVVSRDALIAMKARAARPQDLADVQNLQDLDR